MIENGKSHSAVPTSGSTGDSAPGQAVPTPVGRRFHLVSPAGMVIACCLIAAGYGLCHLLGLREDVAVLFATSHTGSTGRFLGAAVYVLFYLGVVVACPILLLAGAIFAVISRGLCRG